MKVKKSSKLDFFTGKIRDQGSNFSQETPKVATGDLTTKGFFLLIFYSVISIVISCKLVED